MQKLIKKKNIKIGILGGSFDPPHKGHLHISNVALKKFNLNKVMWAITKKNPLKKKPYLNIKDRIKLSKNITKKYKKIFVYYFDDKTNSESTFDLLKYIKKKQKKAELYFLMGDDNLKKFHRWYKWQKIPSLAKIIVFAREYNSIEKISYSAKKQLKKRGLIYIGSKKVKISSSLIKKFW